MILQSLIDALAKLQALHGPDVEVRHEQCCDPEIVDKVEYRANGLVNLPEPCILLS